MTAVLQAAHVSAGYGEVEILHDVSITVAEGEVVAVIGPNGAGKSTLLKAIFGIIPRRAGRIVLAGRDVTEYSTDEVVKRGLSYVPQTENVFGTLTIDENLEMAAYTSRDGVREHRERVYGLFPDLAARPGERASRLSGGQRQMLALARALMLDPQVLLLDEPSASLSPKMVNSIFDKIGEINRSGTAILLVEQNAREALAFAHRGYVLAMGENRLEGDAKSLLDDAEVARLYLGV